MLRFFIIICNHRSNGVVAEVHSMYSNYSKYIILESFYFLQRGCLVMKTNNIYFSGKELE